MEVRIKNFLYPKKILSDDEYILTDRHFKFFKDTIPYLNDWAKQRIEIIGEWNYFVLEHSIVVEFEYKVSGLWDDITNKKYRKRMDEEIEKLLRTKKIEKIKSKINGKA